MSALHAASAPADPTEARRQRGLAIAAVTRIVRKDGVWVVPSQTGNGSHRVNLEPANPTVPMCSCKDFEARGEPCKHVYAVRCVVERESRPEPTEATQAIAGADGATVTEAAPETPAVPLKTTAHRPTYKQAWPAYNKAQVNEKAKFQVLLHDLTRGIPQPPPKPGKGQRPLLLADAIFAIAFKVYSTVSQRRFMSDLATAQAKGFVAKVPHFNSISNYMEDPAVTPILYRLIAESALPLRSVEVDFAADSSGFTTSRFVSWIDAKYGTPRRHHDWVKVHIMTGVKTNIITAVEIHGRRAGDSPQFVPLLDATARHFRINEVSADTMYASYENMEAVGAKGGVPYFAFKSNASGAQGGLYVRMFHLYNLNRDDYLGHYHKRSNVETTNSMVKAKFGDHVRSKTDAAMVNEVLCKILCHNICCLIQSMYELGIKPAFWGEQEAERAPAAEPEPAGDLDGVIGTLAWI